MPRDGVNCIGSFCVISNAVNVLKKVDVAEAAQLEKFGSKLKEKNFPFSFSHGLKLPYLISGMTSFQSTDTF